MTAPKLVRLRNTTTGAVVQVREGKDMGSEWESAEKKPAAKPAAKSTK